MIRNIQECVAERVIVHMQYRGKEISDLKAEMEKMRQVLEDKDVIKCDWCHEWRIYDWTCDFCDRQSCTDCCKIMRYPSWNISGCMACDDCEEIYCTDCRNLKKECLQLPICAKDLNC